MTTPKQLSNDEWLDEAFDTIFKNPLNGYEYRDKAKELIKAHLNSEIAACLGGLLEKKEWSGWATADGRSHDDFAVPVSVIETELKKYNGEQ